jgi:tripartite-type tricarboxylate transporter receptor subunit TctC
VPGYDAGGWLMFAASAQTPKPIVDRLHAELRAIATSAEVRQRFSGMGLIPVDTPAIADMQQFVSTEITRWGRVIRSAGLAGTQ